MIGSLLDVARRHIILFGSAKFAAGLVIGFGLGVYFLPILTAEKGLDSDVLIELQTSAERSGTFMRDLSGSDAFHWGDGIVRIRDEPHLAGGAGIARPSLPPVSDPVFCG